MDVPRTATLPLGMSSASLSYSPAFDLMSYNLTASYAATTWVANLAVYIPISVPFSYPVNRLFWCNGSTLTSSNADMGVYTASGVKIVSAGTTALSGASVPQYVTPSPAIVLSPGRYYLAYVCDNTTSRTLAAVAYTVAALRQVGVLQQALGSASLPATMTPASVANALYPLIGIVRSTTGF